MMTFLETAEGAHVPMTVASYSPVSLAARAAKAISVTFELAISFPFFRHSYFVMSPVVATVTLAGSPGHTNTSDGSAVMIGGRRIVSAAGSLTRVVPQEVITTS